MGDDVTADVTTERRYEASARRWLRAYPPRWRDEREDEVVGVLLDTRPDGAGRLGARAAWDLVRGGALWRLRHRPPLLVWLLWRLDQVQPPEEHVPWARDDIEGRLFPLRRVWLSWPLVVAAAWWLADPAGVRDAWAWYLAGVVAFTVVGCLAPMALRRNQLVQLTEGRRAAEALAADPLLRLRPWRRVSWGRWLVLPVVVAWLSTATVVGVVVGGLGAGARPSPLASTVSPLTPLLVIAVLAYAGLVVGLARRRVGRRPAQPHRTTPVPPHALVQAGVAAVAAVVPVAALLALVQPPRTSWWASWWARASDATGGWDFAVTVVGAVPLLLLLLTPLVHLLVRGPLQRRPDPPLALHDVLSLEGAGQVLVDPPRPVVPPTPAPVPLGERPARR